MYPGTVGGNQVGEPSSARPDATGAAHGDQVLLAFPNLDRFSMLPRMTGAALASAAGFSVAEIDWLRNALDATWSVLHASLPEEQTVHLGFEAAPRSLRLEGGSDSCAATADTSTGQVHIDVTWLAGDIPS